MPVPRNVRRALGLGVLVAAVAGVYVIGIRARSTPATPDTAAIGATERARLRALGYLGWHEESPDALATSGVTIHRRDRALPGLNLYCSEPSGILRFVAMDGTEVHTIDLGIDDDADPDNYCKVAVPLGDDALVAVLEHTMLVKLGLNGTTEWELHRPFHHDVHVTADDRIVAVASVRIESPNYRTQQPITDNVIVVMDARGEFERTLSMAALVAHEPALLARARAHLEEPDPYWHDATQARASAADTARWEWRRHDLFHVNTVAMLPTALALPGGREAPPGSILFCARHLDTIGIIDPETERIIWHWGLGELQWPHHPSLLANGHILLFDNGVARGRSRLLELDPADETIVWRYEPGPEFFSRSRGSAQRLSNGNTLITESSRGRVFEIDEAGTIVWEFLNPQTAPDTSARATIFRMTRLDPATVGRMRWPAPVRARLRALGLVAPE